MGMFDYLTVEPGIKTNFSSEISDLLHTELFQTKSLYRYMEEYVIKKDWCLYRKETDEGGVWWAKVEKSDIIEFHTSFNAIPPETRMKRVSFEATYKRGKLVKIECAEFGFIEKVDLTKLMEDSDV